MSIVFDQVTFDYGSSRSRKKNARPPILCDVSFTIEDNEFCCIIGHTGSGKSTLIEHINGLRMPRSGSVTVNGLRLDDRSSRKKVRRMVGYVSQYPEHQLFAETVFDDVSFGPRNIGFSAEKIEAVYQEAMTSLGLDFEELRDVSPFELSGGQKRRVAFAGILSMQPDILVLDEPMAGLDPMGRAGLMDIIKSLHTSGKTIVMVSHSMEDVAEVADHIVVLNKGCVYMQGSREEIFARSVELRKIGLGIPMPQRFSQQLEEAGMKLSATPYTTDELADLIAEAWFANKNLEVPGLNGESNGL